MNVPLALELALFGSVGGRQCSPSGLDPQIIKERVESGPGEDFCSELVVMVDFLNWVYFNERLVTWWIFSLDCLIELLFFAVKINCHKILSFFQTLSDVFVQMFFILFGSFVHFSACDCSPFGSEHSDCNRQNGQCVCKPGYEGKKCDRCASGFGQISEGCLPCDCDAVGSVSDRCDPSSGQCECLEGVFGLHCRRCQEGFFGFSEMGCTPCSCEALGAVNQTCDQETGQCFCKANVGELACDKCQPLFWGITSGKGKNISVLVLVALSCFGFWLIYPVPLFLIYCTVSFDGWLID